MNRLKSLLTWMLLLVVSHVMGINVTIDPIEIEAGNAAQLIINLSNTETNLTAYQMFLYLPDGVTVQKKSNGKYAYTLNQDRHDGAFTVSVKDAEGGSVLVTCFSADKDVITGTSGELIRLPLEVASTVTTSLQGSLKNIEFSDVNAKAYKPADVTFSLTLKKSVEPVTITADDKTMTYGDDVPTLTYKSSGAALNGTPSLSTTATKTSPVGTYPIKVEKGTVTNEQVTYVDGTLTIEKALLTVGVQNVTITEGDAIPSFTLTYSGFRNGDTESNAFSTKPTATTTATSSSTPGTYPITISGGEAKNYSLTYTQGTLTIQKKSVEPVTITADNKTMTYGDDVPTLTYKSSGAALNGTPSLSTTATKTSPVGTYPIKVEKGTVTNEQVTYVDGTLTIEKAPLTVGVQNVTITEGDAIPSFTLTYSGFRNGDTESNAFSTKPTATTTATSSSSAGTYPITISGGVATNYSLTYTQGTLTIKAKESPSTWTNIVVNNDLEGNDVSCFYMRENYAVNDAVVPATIVNGVGKNNSRGIMVQSVDNFADTWNTQFFVRLPQTIPTGTKYRLSFDYKASREAYVLMEIHAEPSEYIYYDFDHMTFNTTWQHYESEGTITGEMSPEENKMRTIAFDLAHEKTATAYYFDNIVFEIEGSQVEQPVIITANDLTMIYGDEVPKLTYSSYGATLYGTPQLSTTATKTSPVGTYPIKVEKGTVTNEAVTYVDGTLTISKAPLKVGVQDVTITEGDAIPSFVLTYSGFRNGDTESNAFTTKPTVVTTATSSSKAGTYPITISGGDAKNYALSYTQGKLTIKEKPEEPVTITANEISMVYGDEVPTLTYSTEGGTLKGTPKLSTTATKTSPIGTYPIKVERGTVTNEQVTFVDGTLIISKAPLTIGVKDETITEGDTIPTFTLTYDGWRNGDTEATAFTRKPKAKTTATIESKPGTYPITITVGTAKNYKISYQEGTLTIEPAAGIEGVYADSQGNAVIYNVNGQKLSKPRKGINIIGGKKIVVK